MCLSKKFENRNFDLELNGFTNASCSSRDVILHFSSTGSTIIQSSSNRNLIKWVIHRSNTKIVNKGMKTLASSEKMNAGFIDMIGLRLEKFIDSIPILGVPTPAQPWNPLTDTKAALLSDPIVVLTNLLKWDVLARLFEKNTLHLFNTRKGMTNGPKGDNSRGCDLDMEEEPLFAYEDSPIFVTSDDASVERSVASFAEMTTSDGSYQDCPSVVTEGPAQESFGASTCMQYFQVDVKRESQDSYDDMTTDDENEYVLAEEPKFDDEDVVNVGDKRI